MNTRLERVGQVIRDAIAEILRRDIRDPLIGFVTILEVEVSSDLRHAKVFFSVLGDDQQVHDSIKGLLRSRKHINALLGERVDIRYVPKIRFIYDDTAAKAQKMQELLRAQQEQLGPDLERHEAAEQAAATEPAVPADPDEGHADEDFDDEFGDEAPDDENFPEDEGDDG